MIYCRTFDSDVIVNILISMSDMVGGSIAVDGNFDIDDFSATNPIIDIETIAEASMAIAMGGKSVAGAWRETSSYTRKHSRA